MFLYILFDEEYKFDTLPGGFKIEYNPRTRIWSDIQNKIFKTNNYLKNIYEDKVNNIITIVKNLIINYNKDEDFYKEQIISITKKINYYKIKQSSQNYKEIFKKYPI